MEKVIINDQFLNRTDAKIIGMGKPERITKNSRFFKGKFYQLLSKRK